MESGLTNDQLLLGLLRVMSDDTIYHASLFHRQTASANNLLEFLDEHDDDTRASLKDLARRLSGLKEACYRDKHLREPQSSLEFEHAETGLSLASVIGTAWFGDAVARQAERTAKLTSLQLEIRAALSSARQRRYGARGIHPAPDLGFGLGQPVKAKELRTEALDFRDRLAALLETDENTWRPRVVVTIDPVNSAKCILGVDDVFAEAPAALFLMRRHRPQLCVEVAHWFAKRLLERTTDGSEADAVTVAASEFAEANARALVDQFPHLPRTQHPPRSLVHEVTADALTQFVAGDGYVWSFLAHSLGAAAITREESFIVPHAPRLRAQRTGVDPTTMLGRLILHVETRHGEALKNLGATERGSYLDRLSDEAERYVTVLRNYLSSRSATEPPKTTSPGELRRTLDRLKLGTEGVQHVTERPLPELLWEWRVARAALKDEHAGEGRVAMALSHKSGPQLGPGSWNFRWVKVAVPDETTEGGPGPDDWTKARVYGDYNALFWRPGWDASKVCRLVHWPHFEEQTLMIQIQYANAPSLEQHVKSSPLMLVTELRGANAPKTPGRDLWMATSGWGTALVLTPVPTIDQLRQAMKQLESRQEESLSRVVDFSGDDSAETDGSAIQGVQRVEDLGMRVFVQVRPGLKNELEECLKKLDERCVVEWVAGHDDMEIDVPLLERDGPRCLALVQRTIHLLIESKAVRTYDCRLHRRAERTSSTAAS